MPALISPARSYSQQQIDADVPLCVDLDGTLLRTDLFWESLICFACRHPARLLLVLRWCFRGTAYAKQQLARATNLDPALLPYNQPFLAWLRNQRNNGRHIVMATAADDSLARHIAAHLGLFDEVLASNGSCNLKGANKARMLRDRFGSSFDYAGNSYADLCIWECCRKIIAVETPGRLTHRLSKSGRLAELFPVSSSRFAVRIKALRLHQWVKNLLIFLPLIAAHKMLETQRLIPALITFAAFSLVSSATYLVNDLLDLSSDRLHPFKKLRPLAAGDLSVPLAIAWSAVLFLGGIALAMTLSATLVPLLILLYAGTSLAYSLRLKKISLLDVFILSGFYTLRIVAGGSSAGIPLSGWFLSFSVFLFLSLGFAKRAAELRREKEAAVPSPLPGRGYVPGDFQPLLGFGIAASFAAAVVLSLYFQSTEIQALYRRPVFLWGIFPICLYWLTRIWLLASRGALHEDPVTFAVHDRTTWTVIALSAVILRLAA